MFVINFCHFFGMHCSDVMGPEGKKSSYKKSLSCSVMISVMASGKSLDNILLVILCQVIKTTVVRLHMFMLALGLESWAWQTSVLVLVYFSEGVTETINLFFGATNISDVVQEHILWWNKSDISCKSCCSEQQIGRLSVFSVPNCRKKTQTAIYIIWWLVCSSPWSKELTDC